MTSDLGYDPWGTNGDSAFRDTLFGDDLRDDMLSHGLDLGNDFFDEMPHSSKTSSTSEENMYSSSSDTTFSPVSVNMCHNSISEPSEIGTVSSPTNYLYCSDNNLNAFDDELFGLDVPSFSGNKPEDQYELWNQVDYFYPMNTRSPTPKAASPTPDFTAITTPSPDPSLVATPSPDMTVMATPSPKPPSPKLVARPVVEPTTVAQTTLVTTTPVNQEVAHGSRHGNNGPRVVRIPENALTVQAQPYVIPNGARFLRVTRIPSETPVYEAIRAAGVGNPQITRFRAPEQPTIIRQVAYAAPAPPPAAQQAFQPRKVVVLRRQDPNTGQTMETVTVPKSQQRDNNKYAVVKNPPEEEDTDDDWEHDMPVLTREAPFKPEQLPPCVQPQPIQPVIRPVYPVYNNGGNPNTTEDLRCRTCFKVLASRHALAKHVHLHEPPRFKCLHCSRLFYDRTKLRRHQTVHSENLRISSRFLDSDLAFPCVECGKGFTQLIHLQNHRRTHTTRKCLSTTETPIDGQ